MKKLIASILTVLTVVASAQLTYVTTIDAENLRSPLNLDFGHNLIENNKYFIAKKDRYTYNILKSDFSLYKTVTIDTTGWEELNYMINMIEFSDHFYNIDDKVEVIYSILKEKDYSYSVVKTVVIDEDGVELQIIENSYLNLQNSFQSNGKTYLTSTTFSGATGKVDIYEAAGTLPCNSCSSSESTPTQKAPEKIYDINVFPNPTTNQITLAINTDKTGMKVHIYATDGKLVKSANIVNGNNLIDTANLVAGNYIYNVVTDDELIHASQFIKK